MHYIVNKAKKTMLPPTYFQGSGPPTPHDLHPCTYTMVPRLETKAKHYYFSDHA